MFRKIIATMALALFAASSFAQAVDTAGLTAPQVAQIKSQIAQAAAQNAVDASPGQVLGVAATWGQQAAIAAEGFATALSIAAKELGFAVNDFLNTDAGKLTAVLIIWKVAGAAIANLLVGLAIMITGQIIARVIYMKLFTGGYTQVNYAYFFGMFKGTKHVRIPKPMSQLNTDGEWMMVWVMLFVSLATLAIGGAIIA
jgi:hypothetical protein